MTSAQWAAVAIYCFIGSFFAIRFVRASAAAERQREQQDARGREIDDVAVVLHAKSDKA